MSALSKQDYSAARAEAKRGKPCADCGVLYPAPIMTFDHRPGTEKKFNIGCPPGKKTITALLAEIDKCDVVCRNCHGLREYSRGLYPVDEAFNQRAEQNA